MRFLSFNPLASKSVLGNSLANSDHIARILTFLSLTRSYLTTLLLVYARKQEDEKRERKESD